MTAPRLSHSAPFKTRLSFISVLLAVDHVIKKRYVAEGSEEEKQTDEFGLLNDFYDEHYELWLLMFDISFLYAVSFQGLDDHDFPPLPVLCSSYKSLSFYQSSHNRSVIHSHQLVMSVDCFFLVSFLILTYPVIARFSNTAFFNYVYLRFQLSVPCSKSIFRFHYL